MAVAKMMILKPKIKFPIDTLNCLLNIIAKISVPSNAAPPRKAKPIPDPRNTPPNRALRTLSLVISGIETPHKAADNAIIANTLFSAKLCVILHF